MDELVPLDDDVLDRTLGRLVQYAVEGVGPLKGAADLVDPLRRRGLSTSRLLDRLVRTQCTQATVQGAVAGVGGVVTATVGLVPATAAALFVQARLAAAVAHAHGHDLDDPRVRARVAGLLVGSSASTTSKRVGMQVGERALRGVAPRLQARAASRTAARVAAGRAVSPLTRRVAAGGAARAVPFVGAVVGGAVDLAVTRRVAEKARREFGDPATPDQASVPPAPGPTSSA
ncbi:EcsC family protein [Thalassiella azotivora]